MTSIAESVPTPIDPSITWDRTCALLRTLALDVRQMEKPLAELRPADFLVRGTRWVHGRKIECDYFLFDLKFNVSAVAVGAIPIADCQAIAAFERELAAALNSEQTKAEQDRWMYDAQRLAVERDCGICPESESLLDRQREAASRSYAHYEAQRAALELEGRRASHEDIIEALIANHRSQ